jgi:hypothetical protein
VRFTRAGQRRLLLYPALLSLGAGLLVSCAGDEPPPAQISAIRPFPPHPDKSALPPSIARPAHKPNPPGTAETSASPDGDVLATTAPRRAGKGSAPEPSLPPPGVEATATSLGPSDPLLPKTSELIGLDQPAATRLFGAGAERFEEPPATVWRYKNATCELDLFFYLDLRSGRMRTLHFALKDEGADAAGVQDCLRSLLVARSN